MYYPIKVAVGKAGFHCTCFCFGQITFRGNITHPGYTVSEV